jgi:Cu-processing system permease protein
MSEIGSQSAFPEDARDVLVGDVSDDTTVPRGPGALATTLLMVQVTFREAARRKILWIAALAGCAFLVLWAFAEHAMFARISPEISTVRRREGMILMTMMVIYAGSIMTALMAALTSCDTLSGEIASGTIHAIATKPVRRWTLVLGKWLGFACMLSLYEMLVTGGTILISRIESGVVMPHAMEAMGLIWLQLLLMLGITIAASTRFTALTAGSVTLGLYGLGFVGGWIEQYGSLMHVPACVDLGIVSSLIMPADALWRLAALKLQPPLLGAAGVSPFASSSFPSNAMVVYAAAYALLALLLAAILFERRDL